MNCFEGLFFLSILCFFSDVDAIMSKKTVLSFHDKCVENTNSESLLSKLSVVNQGEYWVLLNDD